MICCCDEYINMKYAIQQCITYFTSVHWKNSSSGFSKTYKIGNLIIRKFRCIKDHVRKTIRIPFAWIGLSAIGDVADNVGPTERSRIFVRSPSRAINLFHLSFLFSPLSKRTPWNGTFPDYRLDYYAETQRRHGDALLRSDSQPPLTLQEFLSPLQRPPPLQFPPSPYSRNDSALKFAGRPPSPRKCMAGLIAVSDRIHPFVRLPNRLQRFPFSLSFLRLFLFFLFFFFFRLFQSTIRGGTITFLRFLGVDGERDIIRDNVISLFVDLGYLMFDFLGFFWNIIFLKQKCNSISFNWKIIK